MKVIIVAAYYSDEVEIFYHKICGLNSDDCKFVQVHED